MGRPQNSHGGKARIDGVLKRFAERTGVPIKPFIVEGTKMKHALFGDVYVTATTANQTKVIAEMRRYYRNIDSIYPIAVHAYAIGMESARVEMSLDAFTELLKRLTDSDPDFYLRKHTHRKDTDE